MIKKILPFLLIVALMISLALSPMCVNADMGYSVNLLDFVSVNPNGSNAFTFTSSGTAQFNVSSTLVNLRSYSFDILLQYTGSTPSSYSVSHNKQVYFDTTVTELGSGLVRLTGSFSGYVVQNFCVDFISAGTTYTTFLSFEVSITPVNRIDLGTILTNGATSVTLSPGGQVSVPGLPNATSCMFSFKIPYSVWSNYDCIDFSGFIANGEISSITAYTGDDAFVPIDTSVIIDMSQRSLYYYSCRLDLSQGNLAYSGDIQVWFSASVVSNSGELGLWGLSGVILADEFDTEATWDQIINRRLVAISSALTSTNTHLNNIYSKTSAILNYLVNSIKPLFDNILQGLSKIYQGVDTMRFYVTSYFPQFLDYLASIAEGNAVDQEVVDGMQQSQGQMEQLENQMSSLTPEVNANDIEIPLDDLIPSDQASANNIMITITNNELVLQFLLIAVSFALIGFVFFGKR